MARAGRAQPNRADGLPVPTYHFPRGRGKTAKGFEKAKQVNGEPRGCAG